MNKEWTIRTNRLPDGSQLSLVAFMTDEKAGTFVKRGSKIVSRSEVDRNGRAWREVVNQAVVEASFDKLIPTLSSHQKTKSEGTMVNVQEKISGLTEMNSHLEQVKGSLSKSLAYYKGLSPNAVSVGPELSPQEVISEAVNDFTGIQDGIGQVITESNRQISRLKVARPSERVAADVKALGQKAVDLIREARRAETHWKSQVKVSAEVQGAESLKDAPDHIQKVYQEATGLRKLLQALNPLFSRTGTYNAPTEVKDTGDKWPAKGDSAKVEVNHWHAGNEEFKRTKTKEDRNPNAAAEPRLTDAGSPHDAKPYINATLVRDRIAKQSQWIVTNNRTGRKIAFSFGSVCPNASDVTKENYAMFTSDDYRAQIIREASRYGMDYVKRATMAKEFSLEKSGTSSDLLRSAIAKLEIEAKTNPKKRAKLIQLKKLAEDEMPPMGPPNDMGGGEPGEGGEKPEKETETTTVEVPPVEKAVKQIEKAVDTIVDQVGLEEPGEKKEEPGEPGEKEEKPPTEGNPFVMSSRAKKVLAQEGTEGLVAYYTKAFGDAGYARELVKMHTKASKTGGISRSAATARADQAVQLARLQASRGLIPFTKQSVKEAALKVAQLDTYGYKYAWDFTEALPEVEPLALTAGEIPEAEDIESGVVGNRTEGVRNPLGKVKVQGEIANNVASDAAVESGPVPEGAKSARMVRRAGIVPQIQSDFSGAAQALPFTTTESRLAAMGVDGRKYVRAHYRNN